MLVCRPVLGMRQPDRSETDRQRVNIRVLPYVSGFDENSCGGLCRTLESHRRMFHLKRIDVFCLGQQYEVTGAIKV